MNNALVSKLYIPLPHTCKWKHVLHSCMIWVKQHILNETVDSIFGGYRSKSPHTGQLKSKVPQSGHVFTFVGWGGGVLWTSSNPKSLNLAKFSWGRDTLDQLKSKVPTSLTIFFSGDWVGTHSSNTWVRALKEFLTKNSRSLACLCITHSPSYTTCVDTNDVPYSPLERGRRGKKMVFNSCVPLMCTVHRI